MALQPESTSIELLFALLLLLIGAFLTAVLFGSVALQVNARATHRMLCSARAWACRFTSLHVN